VKLKDLQDRRAKIIAEMRSITEAPANAGDLSDEQAKRFDTLKGDLETTEASIGRQTLLDEAERRMQGHQVAGTGDTRLDAEIRAVPFLDYIRLSVPNLDYRGDLGRARELSQEVARRSGLQFQGVAVPTQAFETRVTTTTGPVGGPGSNLIATDHLGNQYIDSLRAALVINRLGAMTLNDLTGNVEIPKRKGSVTADWFAENAAITFSDQQFTKVSMAPKHVGCITELSRNMLLQTSPDIDQLTRADFAAVLAEAMDRAAIKGGGSDEPNGILEESGLDQTVDLSTPTWDGVLEMIEHVQTANSEGTSWLTNPKVVRKLRGTLKVSGDASGGFLMESPTQLAGYPAASTTLVPDNGDSPPGEHIIFGKWSDLLLGFWSAFDLLVNPFESTAFTKGNVQVRGIITADIAVRHVESFTASAVVTG
jgi:HK97 family phage major capsid protein